MIEWPPGFRRQSTVPDMRASGARTPAGPVPAHVHLRERERFLMRQPVSVLRAYAGELGARTEGLVEKREIVQQILSKELRPTTAATATAPTSPTGSARQGGSASTPFPTVERMQSTVDDARLAQQLQDEENRRAGRIQTTVDNARSSGHTRIRRALGQTPQQAQPAAQTMQHLPMFLQNASEWDSFPSNGMTGQSVATGQGVAVDLGSAQSQQRRAAFRQLRAQAAHAAEQFEQSRRAAFDFGPQSRNMPPGALQPWPAQPSGSEPFAPQAAYSSTGASVAAPGRAWPPGTVQVNMLPLDMRVQGRRARHRYQEPANAPQHQAPGAGIPWMRMMQGQQVSPSGMPMFEFDPVAFLQAVTAEQAAHVNRGVDPSTIDATTGRMIYTGAAQTSHDDGPAEAGGVASSLASEATAGAAGAADVSRSGAEFQCTICLELFKQGEELRVLPCLHKYHRACVDQWLARSPACPVCKHEIVAT